MDPLEVEGWRRKILSSIALWASVPLVTTPAGSFASRVGSSLVKSCGVNDVVVNSYKQYEDHLVSLLKS